jgi:soluble lytic murein transglycosylase-like protein
MTQPWDNLFPSMGIASRLLCVFAVVGLLGLGWVMAAGTPDPSSTQAFGPGAMNEAQAPNAVPAAPVDAGTAPPNVVADATVQPTGPKAIKAMLYAGAVKRGLNPYLVMGLAWHESGWQPSIVSYAGAVGIMQVMPSTAAVAGPSLLHKKVDLFNPTDNIDMGTALLRDELDHFGNNYVKAVVAYYSGGGAVREWTSLSSDQRRYVLSVYADAELFATGRDPA